MKKYLFSLVTIVMMVLVCVSFTACGSDDDDNGGGGSGAPTTGSLVGIWKRTYRLKVYYTKNENGEWVETSRSEKTYDDNTESKGYLYKDDNTGQELHHVKADGSYTTEGDTERFNYKIEKGHLFLKYIEDRDADGWEDLGPINISGNTYEIITDDTYGNSKEVETERFKKI